MTIQLAQKATTTPLNKCMLLENTELVDVWVRRNAQFADLRTAICNRGQSKLTGNSVEKSGNTCMLRDVA